MFEILTSEERTELLDSFETQYRLIKRALITAQSIIVSSNARWIRNINKKLAMQLTDMMIENVEIRDDILRRR
jgi:hypothetical protein